MRLLSIGDKNIVSSSIVSYMDLQEHLSSFSNEFSTSFRGGEIDSVYAAALFSSPETKSSPRHTWGNVKDPYLDLSSNVNKADSEGCEKFAAQGRLPT